MNMVYRRLKKVLMGQGGTIHLSIHAKEQMAKRGYNKRDIALVIYNGKVIETQHERNFKLVIAGLDQSRNPMVVVVAWKGGCRFEIVTVMPPIDRRRFEKCIG
jgi:hypothetical protein